VQTVPGPNRLVENLEAIRSLNPVLRTGALSEDLARLAAVLQGQTSIWKYRREALESQSAAAADGAVETSLQLARLWASEVVNRLKSKREIDQATRLAGLFQLVTPVSGAVVLETQQQYDQTGLKPVEPQTVPSIPEPTTAALVLVGVVLLAVLRRKLNRHRAINSSIANGEFPRARRG